MIQRLTYISILCIISLFIQSTENIHNTVDHKDSQLNLYLDFIRYNTQEKLGILPYMLKNGGGTFLEVGTGGDPIANLLAQIPDDLALQVIASDVDSAILDMLPIRHPRLNKYLEYDKKGPRLKLQQLDATNMTCFGNESLDGINASAVVHEIVSYAGGFKGIDQFFSESYRTLKPGGVLIYRDPEAVHDKYELVDVELYARGIRLFSHIFLPKFLDSTCGRLAQSGRKANYYSEKDITFIVYKKNEPTQSHFTYNEYLKIRSADIDFSRRFIIKMPRGLCRELERHYLTYLHQGNPLVFVKCLPNIGSAGYYVNFLAHSTQRILSEFLHTIAAKIVDGAIDASTKSRLDETILKNTYPLEYGIALKFSFKQKKAQLWELLKQYHFDPSLHITHINDSIFLLDYRIFGLLFDQINDLMDEHNGPTHRNEMIHAQWLKREGEEHYIYYNDDELIAHVAQLAHNLNTGYVLCPLSVESTSFVPRLCYEEVLNGCMRIHDSFSYLVEIKEGKRIIHFAKLSVEKAMPIYETLVAQDPQRYVNLQSFFKTVYTKSESGIHA